MTLTSDAALRGVCEVPMTKRQTRRKVVLVPSFILRDIDEDFWKKVKSKAAAEGITIKALILQLLERWVKQ
jgi:hypothetical protein